MKQKWLWYKDQQSIRQVGNDGYYRCQETELDQTRSSWLKNVEHGFPQNQILKWFSIIWKFWSIELKIFLNNPFSLVNWNLPHVRIPPKPFCYVVRWPKRYILKCVRNDGFTCTCPDGFCVNKSGKFRCRCNDGFEFYQKSGQYDPEFIPAYYARLQFLTKDSTPGNFEISDEMKSSIGTVLTETQIKGWLSVS